MAGPRTEPYEGFLITSRRVGRKGEYAAFAEEIDGEKIIQTERFSGFCARDRAWNEASRRVDAQKAGERWQQSN